MPLRFEDDARIDALPAVVADIRTKRDASRLMPLIYTPGHINRTFDHYDAEHASRDTPVQGHELRWPLGQAAVPEFWRDQRRKGKTTHDFGVGDSVFINARRWWYRRWFPRLAETILVARRAHDAMVFWITAGNPALTFPRLLPPCSHPGACVPLLRKPDERRGYRWPPCAHCAWRELTKCICDLVEFDKRYLHARFTRFAVEKAPYVEADWEFLPRLGKALGKKGRRWRTTDRNHAWLHIAFDARARYHRGRDEHQVHELIRDVIEAYRLLCDDRGGRRDGKVKRFLRDHGFGPPTVEAGS